MTVLLRSSVFISLVFLVCFPAFANNGKIQGKVKEENGKALAGVHVKALRSATRTLENPDDSKNAYEVKTDDKGEFILAGLPAGSYTLTFELTGYRTSVTRQRLELREGEEYKAPKAFELRRVEEPYGLIRGAVLDKAGYSLQNARITIERIDGRKFKKLEKNSLEGGEFAFRVPGEKGEYRLTAMADGFAAVSRDVTIDGDEIRQVVLQLEKKPNK